MGFLSRFREKTTKLTLPLLLAGAASLGVGGVAADELAVLSAARVHGAQNSDWNDRQLFRNPTGLPLTGRLYLTERGASFNPATDPVYVYALPAGTTLILDGLYAQLKPGVNGAGTLRLVPDEGQAAPLWRTTMYDKVGDQEFGASATPFDPDVDGYHAAGQTLGTVLSPDGYRDNPHVQSGPDGLVGTWVYTGPAGGEQTLKPESIAPNTTKQYTNGVTELLGFAPAPGGQLDLRITGGEGRAYLTRMNNASNDPAYDEFSVTATQPRITGIDWNNDGIADWVDADHNGILDGSVAVGCSAPYPWQGRIIVQPSSAATFVGADLPQGMGVEPGTGKILYSPPCSTAGSSFTPRFYAMENGQQTPLITTTFRVTN